MRKTIKTLAATAAVLCCSSAAYSAEWQPIGTLGIGGAGVARQMGAFTAYWNPAGGAFNDKTFSFMTGAEFGVRGNDALTDNVDKISKIKFDNLKNFTGANATPEAVADAVKLIGILDDISKRGGNLAISGGVPVGFAIKHLSFGVYGNFEGSVIPIADSTNIMPNQASGTKPADIYNALTANGTSFTTDNGYFTANQQTQLRTTLTSGPNGLSTADANNAIYQLEAVLKAQGQPADVAFASAQSLLSSISAGGTNTINKNTTSVLSKALLYAEAPIAYGHPFNLGRYGTLGVGLAVKAIAGSVYQNQVLLVNDPSGKTTSSGDLGKQLTKNHEESNNLGIDAGLLWKKDIVSVGVVAKNLNRPTFKAPSYQKYTNDPTTGAIVTTTAKGEDIALDPMVRAGVAVDPWKWLTIAADMDLTKNTSVGPTTVIKSQNIGGGLEIHPWSILKLRAGAMKNIASVDGGTNPVIVTAGLSFLFLDLDAAAATKTFKVKDNTIPEELRVQLMAGFSF